MLNPLSRGRQPGDDPPLRATDMSACVQPSSGLLPQQSVDIPQQDPSPVDESVPLGDTLRQGLQDVPAQSRDLWTQLRSFTASRGAPEQLRRVHSLQQTPAHLQALRGDTVETREAEWPVASAQEGSSKDLGDAESDRRRMTVEWRHQRSRYMFLSVVFELTQGSCACCGAFHHTTQASFNSLSVRMASLEAPADLSDDQMELISQKIHRINTIFRESVEISSFTPTDHQLVSDLKVHFY
ncbi:uncharacterized protein LOC129602952 [Betta splendens]|uniref:Uncharacterized protein LOC129602952 n=1 Tax=Betta splendens TaxID=158456 RepID=A0A9W2XK55_BETSP|nr:uncharacterized protein LOC129602952 [Betta splendens]